MASFRVFFSQKAGAEFKKLPFSIQVRIKEKLKAAGENPFRYFERLKGRMDYKLRVGDYRVIADINEKIEVTKIGHRKNIYKEI